MKRSRKELLLERIAKLENYVFSNDSTEELKSIYREHAKFLRKELKSLKE